MTRPSGKEISSGTRPQAREASAKVPDKPRDCGPHVDTWPIIDEQVGDAPKPKTDEYGNGK